MLDGHARVGSWMAISVHVKNDGPSMTGELRLTGGSQGRTRFGLVADLPNDSDKTFLLYAQPPSFGRDLEVSLVDGDSTIATTKVAFTIHDLTQLVVGVVAEKPGGIIRTIHLLPNQNQVAPVIVPIDLADLPERVEAWGGARSPGLAGRGLEPAHPGAARTRCAAGWPAAVASSSSAGRPARARCRPSRTTLLPYRPTATVDVAGRGPQRTRRRRPVGRDRPARRWAATMTEGRALLDERRPGHRRGARLRQRLRDARRLRPDRQVDRRRQRRPRPSGAGSCRHVPRRPGALRRQPAGRRRLAAAVARPAADRRPVRAAVAYILLIGPINYLVLRRLDRREWAWVTMPALIVVFAVGAYGFGAALRGSDVMVNEVALVRGSPGATDGTAQVYLGVFSPSRGTYQVSVPGGALLSSPINGDFFGGDSTAGTLDVLQGDPAKVRDLAVGFGSLRTIRAETPGRPCRWSRPSISIVDGRLKGTVTNESQTTLERPAVVLGGDRRRAQRPGAGRHAAVDVAAASRPSSASRCRTRSSGQIFFGDPSQFGNQDSDHVHPPHDRRPADLRPELRLDRPAPDGQRGHPRLGLGQPAPGRDRRADDRGATGNVLYYLPTRRHGPAARPRSAATC